MAEAKDRSVTVDEIRKHASAEDCWIVVDDIVWDITSFAPSHPGGPEIIYKFAGRDATQTYTSIHAPSLLPSTLSPSARKGILDKSSASKDPEWLKPPPSAQPELAVGEKPPLQSLINSYDFEHVASETLSKKAWAFYSSAATDLVTRDANISMFGRMWLRPRILRDVKSVSTRTTMLGCELSLPLFVSPAAMVKMAHPEGEKAMARACAREGVAHLVSTNASFSISEIHASSPTTPFFFQLYVNKDRTASSSLLATLEALNVKGIFVTVDAPVPGKREADERVKAEVLSVPMSGASSSNDSKGGGLGRSMAGFIDPTLNWKDVAWLRRSTKLPLCIKGVQTAADALLAAQYGLDGIMVSNHGGRNLDGSPPAILTLLEIRKQCPEVFDKLEVYIDSGIRRGTDMFKALCLGAKAVGMGRPFLYAVNYGQEGVEHLINIMRDEFETTMRQCGVTDVSQLHSGLVNTLDVEHLVSRQMDDLTVGRPGKAKL